MLFVCLKCCRTGIPLPLLGFRFALLGFGFVLLGFGFNGFQKIHVYADLRLSVFEINHCKKPESFRSLLIAPCFQETFDKSCISAIPQLDRIQGKIDIASSGAASLALPAITATPGWHQLQVEVLSDDVLAADNRFFAAVLVPQPIDVLVAEPEAREAGKGKAKGVHKASVKGRKRAAA